jgi:hypothetical protein
MRKAASVRGEYPKIKTSGPPDWWLCGGADIFYKNKRICGNVPFT